MEKIWRYKSVETNASQANQTRIFFPDQPDLRDAIIHSIVTYNANDITLSPQTGSAIATNADFNKTSLVMFEQAQRKIDHMPLVTLHELQNSQTQPNTFTRNQKQFNKLNPSWDKCYVELTSAISSANLVYVFDVYYSLPGDK